MKKATRFALIFSFILLYCTACADDKNNELLQTEHVPGEEHAAVYTATPTPPMQGAVATVTPTDGVDVTPIPTMPIVPTMPALPEEEPEFLNLYHSMPAGTRVNIEGVPEEQVRYCFYCQELTERLENGLAGHSGSDKPVMNNPGMIRVLYYRDDGKLYICDAIAEDNECEDIRNLFYLMYQQNRVIGDWTVLPDEMTSLGYKVITLSLDGAEYLYIYK